MPTKFHITPTQTQAVRPLLAYMKDNLDENLLLSQDRMATFLRRTNLNLMYAIPTSRPGVIKPILDPVPLPGPCLNILPEDRPAVPKYAVSSPEDFRGQGKDHFLSLVQHILSQTVQKPIELYVPHHTRRAERTTGGTFQIYVWSAPETGGGHCTSNVPEKMWGHYVGCRDESFNYTGHGIALTHEGYTWGELSKHSLYIYQDIVDRHTVDDLCIFAYMLKQAAELYASTDWSKIDEIKEEERLRAEQEVIRRMAKRTADRARKRAARTIKDLEAAIKTKQEEWFELNNQVAVAKADLTEEGIEDKFLGEFNRLKDFEQIETARFEGNTLIVTTKPLNSHDRRNGNDYHLGPIEMKMSFGGYTSVYMKSLNKGRNRRTLPHCSEGAGEVCLGNISKELNSYTSNFEMLAAVSMMLSFIQNGVDTGDPWGRNLLNFPRL